MEMLLKLALEVGFLPNHWGLRKELNLQKPCVRKQEKGVSGL